ncbi:MAG: carboxypeptidase M32 [Gammaproteobacteria bacterium]|nr:carboxypeptidase M32 [Gammaproteobacteria bacterium]
MSSAYSQLKDQLTKISHLNHLRRITEWDEAVMMPAGSGEARATALATLSEMIHDMETSDKIKDFIQHAKTESLIDPWEKKNLTLIERNYRRSTCVPTRLIAESTKANSLCEQAWRQLRADNNWKDFLPLLKKSFSLIVEIAQSKADALQCDPYDAMIDEFSSGFNQAIIDPIFARLKKELPDRVEKIISFQQKEKFLTPAGPFPIDSQRQLGLELMQALGFNFQQGRLDVSHHPFCGGVQEDVRITTRYNENEFISAAMGICHETGHARYEQALPTQWSGQPVGDHLGMAVHESQSLLVEMYACRTREFMEFLSPRVIHFFGDQPSLAPDNLYSLYTRVKRGYIRVDADEVTYPLHVILRYELEQQLFKKQLTLEDLPDAWNEKMQTYFHLSTVDNYRNGVMQDVHWPVGLFGYFPAYTLGSLIAAQLFSTVTKAHPELFSEIKHGNFSTLFKWLNTHIHSRASSVDVTTLIKDATGSDLDPNYYLAHIDERYLP